MVSSLNSRLGCDSSRSSGIAFMSILIVAFKRLVWRLAET